MKMKEQMTNKEYRRFSEAQRSAGDDRGHDDGDFADPDKERQAQQNAKQQE